MQGVFYGVGAAVIPSVNLRAILADSEKTKPAEQLAGSNSGAVEVRAAGDGHLLREQRPRDHGGIFPSPIGPEVLAVKDNWNWSRSDLFFGLPFYHAGARVAYPLGAGWTAMLHVYNGWNNVVDNNAYPSVAVSAAYAGDRLTGQVLYFGGIERSRDAAEGNAWRHLVDAYATIAIGDQVSVLVHGNSGVEPNDIGTSAWLAAAAYAKVQLSSKLYGAVNADYFREWLASDDDIEPSRAASPVFFGGEVVGDGEATPHEPNRRAQETITVGATAWL